MSQKPIYDCFHCGMTIYSDDVSPEVSGCGHRFHKLCACDLKSFLLRSTKICYSPCLSILPFRRFEALKLKLESSELLKLEMDVRNNIINHRAERQIKNSKIEERKLMPDKAISLNSTGTDHRIDASLNKLMTLVEANSKNTSELIESTKNIMQKINQPQDGLEETKTRLDRFEKCVESLDTRMAETLSHLNRIKITEDNLTLKINDLEASFKQTTVQSMLDAFAKAYQVAKPNDGN